MSRDGENPAPWLLRRRSLALTVAVSVVVVGLGLALVISNGAAARSVSANARYLHWVNSVLGSAAIARAGNAQAVVFAVDRDLGVASAGALEIAVAEAENTLEALRNSVLARPKGFPDAGGDINAGLSLLMSVDEEVLQLIRDGRVLEAVDVSQNELEDAYRQVEEALTSEQTRLADLIDETEGTLGRVASFASVLVTLLIPATALIIYFLLARRQLRDKRIAMEAELEAERQLSRAKDEFIGGLSHELRTPLTSIYGFSEVLLESGLVDPRQAIELIALINTEAADLSRMVEDLLTAARIEAEALSVEIGEVSLLTELESVVEPFRRAGTSVLVACPPLTVLADRLRLRQVLRNLVSNAVRHGGPSVRIEARGLDGTLQMAVIDDGAGVSPDVADRLFERFVHEGREALLAGSVGLGLAIARSLMEAMGGTIAYSRVEGHTVFSITLPMAALESPVGSDLVFDIDDWDGDAVVPALILRGA